PGTIRVDAQQVQQVILNLVVNAFEAMPEGGKLKLEVRPESNGDGETRLLFSVSDTGPGIAAEHLETIFDPFYTTKPQGTGFGLSLANTIVTQNGGGIVVSSTVGVGSTFTISFPFYPLKGAAEDAEKSPAEMPNPPSPLPMGKNA
ncbi:MAG: ATP-binding protein, partial [bacterium]